MDADQKKVVDILLKKAADATDAAKALHFSQAACNAANALRQLVDVEKVSKS
jgi:hypothetical protein